jgi:hypothetical protein
MNGKDGKLIVLWQDIHSREAQAAESGRLRDKRKEDNECNQ